MTTAKKYIKQVDEILKAAAPEGKKRPEFEWKSVTAAKKTQKILNGLLEELRKVKQSIHDEMDKLKEEFSVKKSAASRGANLSGRGGFLMKKGTMSNMQLVDLRRQELASLFPYESAMRRVDEEITALDKVNHELEKFLVEHPSSKAENE